MYLVLMFALGLGAVDDVGEEFHRDGAADGSGTNVGNAEERDRTLDPSNNWERHKFIVISSDSDES